MTLWDRFWVSIRHVRGRIVESILVIVATAVGVALVAAMVAFIRSYDTQTEYLLSHPAYRELLVETVGNETELTEAAVPFDPEVTSEARVGIDDIALALESASLVSYGYVADRTTLSTELFGGFRGGGHGGGGGFAGVSVAPAGQTPGDAQAGTSAETPEGGQGGFFAFPAPPGGAAAGEESAEGDGGFAVVEEVPAGALQFNPRAGGADTGGEPPKAGATPTGDAPEGGFAQLRGQGGERPEFNAEQFFAVADDVLTELPLESFPGIRITPDYFDAYGLQVSEGSLFTVEDAEAGNQTLVLGSALASTLFPDGDAVGTKVRLGFQTYTIIGVLEPTGLTDPSDGTAVNSMGFVPNADAQVSFGGNTVRFQRGTRTIHFAVAASGTLEEAADQLQIHFDAEYGEGAVRITAPIDELRAERDKLARILAVVLFLATAALFIASINLFNLMLMRVIKRTKGIGITRAIGAARRDIFRQFLNESAFMSLIGAAIGLAVSPIVYNLLRSALISDVSAASVVYWPFLIVGAAAALAFSILFGVYPAQQAGKIDAAIAVRTE